MSGGSPARRIEGSALVAVAACFAFQPLPRQAADPWPVLERAAAAYAASATLTADFVQIVTNPLLGAPDTTRGRLYLRRPDRFALRFTHPAGDRVVADGVRLWLYTPSTTPGQVIRTTVPDVGGTGPNLIGQFLERPRERYRATYVRPDSLHAGWADVIALTPFVSGAPYSEATIWVSRADGLVRRMEITESSGQRRIFVFDRVRPNGAVPGREIRFSPPTGVRVVDQ